MIGEELEPIIFDFVELAALFIELLAVAIIVLSVAIGMAMYIRHMYMARRLVDERFEAFRRTIAKALLLGLELLVAADIVNTVVLAPTLENVAVLGLLVLIRIFLGWSLIVEMEGRWPWQPKREDADDSGEDEPRADSSQLQDG